MPNTPSFTPLCPWCAQPLEGCGFPLPRKGTGRCPAGGIDVNFEVEIDEVETFKDKNGNVQKQMKWKVSADPH